MSNNNETKNEIADLLDRVCELASIRHSNEEETFIECSVCDGWEEHKDDCPMPAIDKWMSIPYQNNK